MHSEKFPKPDRSADSLEARLRALPQPPVPANLEARLLAAIPSRMTIPRRRWAVWVGALAAACLLIVLAWLNRDGKHPLPDRGKDDSVHNDGTQRYKSVARTGRRFQEDTDMSKFTWPVEEIVPMRVSTSIPADLLD